MPVYDYECEHCGVFTAMRPMAECERTHECPGCGVDAPRAFLTAPFFSAMSAERRTAHATNERSAHAPRVLNGAAKHSTACKCCAPTSRAKTGKTPRSAKSFPSRRPWMLSH
jgi:putative FmdB family regulatory protein